MFFDGKFLEKDGQFVTGFGRCSVVYYCNQISKHNTCIDMYI